MLCRRRTLGYVTVEKKEESSGGRGDCRSPKFPTCDAAQNLRLSRGCGPRTMRWDRAGPYPGKLLIGQSLPALKAPTRQSIYGVLYEQAAWPLGLRLPAHQLGRRYLEIIEYISSTITCSRLLVARSSCVRVSCPVFTATAFSRIIRLAKIPDW